MAEAIASAFVEVRGDTSKLTADAEDGVLSLKRSLAKADAMWADIINGSQRAGEGVEDSFREAGRASDEALDKIGGPDVFNDVKTEAARAGESVERSFREAARASDTHLSGAGNAARGLFGVVAGAAAAFGGIQLFKGAIDQASDLNESMNAVNVMFGDAADGIHALGATAATDLGLTEGQFNGLAVSFGAFASTISGPGGDVAATMDTLTGRAADFASVMNLEVNDAAQLFQSGLAGESEPLRKFGIDLSDTSIKAYAYANGIAAQGAELTEAQKVQARYGSLLEQTNKVQGDFANTSGELANGMRILKANVAEAGATFGAAFLPGLKDVVAGANGVITQISGPLTALGTSMGEALSPLMDALGPTLTVVVNVASDVMGNLATVLGALAPLVSPIVQVIGVLVNALGGALAAAFTALTPAIKIVADFLNVFAEHLGGLLFDALDAITPMLTTMGEILSGALAKVLPEILDLFDQLAPILIEIAEVLAGSMAEALPDIVDAFVGIFEAVKPLIPILVGGFLVVLKDIEPILPLLVDAFVAWKVAAGLVSVAQLALNVIMAANPVFLVVAAIGALVVGLFELYTHVTFVHNAVDSAWQIMQSVWDFITNLFVTAWHALDGAVHTVIDTFTNLPGQIGDALSAVGGFITGLPGMVADMVASVVGSFVDLAARALEAATGMAGNIVGAIGGMATEAIAAIGKFVLDAVVWYYSLPVKAAIALAGLAGAVLGPIADMAGRGLSAVGEWVGNVLGKVGEFVTGIPGKLAGLAGALGSAIASGTGGALTAIGTFVTNALDKLGDFVVGIPGKLLGLASGLTSGIHDALKNAWNSVVAHLPTFHADPLGRFGPDINFDFSFLKLARGGIVDVPTLALMGERRRAEAVVPMTRPADAMAVLSQSGLGAMWDRARPSLGNGPVMHIAEANFYDGTDAELVAQRTYAALQTLLLTTA